MSKFEISNDNLSTLEKLLYTTNKIPICFYDSENKQVIVELHNKCNHLTETHKSCNSMEKVNGLCLKHLHALKKKINIKDNILKPHILCKYICSNKRTKSIGIRNQQCKNICKTDGYCNVHFKIINKPSQQPHQCEYIYDDKHKKLSNTRCVHLSKYADKMCGIHTSSNKKKENKN